MFEDPVDPNAQIPEQDREAARRAAQRSIVDYKRLRLIDVACLVIPAIGAIIIWIATGRVLAAIGWHAPTWLLPVFCTCLYLVSASMVYSGRYRRAIYAELNRRGFKICRSCGYLRKGLEDTAPCPECGRALAQSTEPMI